MKIKEIGKKLLRRAIKEAYWRWEAYKEDDWTSSFIYTECPPGADNDTVLALIDKTARQEGGLAKEVVRAFSGKRHEPSEEKGEQEPQPQPQQRPKTRAERYRKGRASRYDGYFPPIHGRGEVPEGSGVLQGSEQGTERRRKDRNRGPT